MQLITALTTRQRALGMLALAAALMSVFALATAGTARAVPPTTSTFEVRLQHLEILATNENRDEVRIKFQPYAGASAPVLWSGSNLDRGDIRDLGLRSALFRATWDARFIVHEMDCGCWLDPNDYIGSVRIAHSPGSYTAIVAGDDARYRLYYQVVRA